LGPIILAVLYLILHKNGAVDTLPVNQVCVGIFSITALAFFAGGMNAIYQIERLPLMTAILIHGSVLYFGVSWHLSDQRLAGQERDTGRGFHLHFYRRLLSYLGDDLFYHSKENGASQSNAEGKAKGPLVRRSLQYQLFTDKLLNPWKGWLPNQSAFGRSVWNPRLPPGIRLNSG